MITVKLILNEHFPEKNGVWDDGDFAKVQDVTLTNKNISAIENLELFDNIENLSLQRNKIRRIENISHLLRCQSLDLSDNLIDEEGLRAESFPPNLKFLKLSGNPCVTYVATMEKLQLDYPLLNIEADSKSKSNESLPSSVVADGSDVLNPASSTATDNANSFLDSESVLREVVNRKCRLQSLVNVNMDSTIQNLEKEYDVVTQASRNRRGNQNAYMSDTEASSVVDVTTEHAPLFESRLGELKAKASTIEGERKSLSNDDFFDKLRAKSFKKYDEKIRDIKGTVLEQNANDEEKSKSL